MPILLMGLMALAVFLLMGLMLFSATIGEWRTRERATAATPPGPASGDDTPTSAALTCSATSHARPDLTPPNSALPSNQASTASSASRH